MSDSPPQRSAAAPDSCDVVTSVCLVFSTPWSLKLKLTYVAVPGRNQRLFRGGENCRSLTVTSGLFLCGSRSIVPVYSAIARPRSELWTAKHYPFGRSFLCNYCTVSKKRVGKIETKGSSRSYLACLCVL